MNKKQQWLDILSHTDDRYLEEADPYRNTKKKRNGAVRRVATGIAACFAFVMVAVSLWLFIPYDTSPPDVGAYSSSSYYGVIEKLNLLTYKKPDHKNNFDALFGSLNGAGSLGGDHANAEGATGEPGSSGGSDGSEGYVEVTDNQVAGVIEGDIFKRSDTHIFYLREGILEAYTIQGEDSSRVGDVTVSVSGYSATRYSAEMYLSPDADTATVLMAAVSNADRRACVLAVSVDVSDPANMSIISHFAVSGSYITSRLSDGKLLIFSLYSPNRNGINYSDESTFVPQINLGQGDLSIPAENIYIPEAPTSTVYTVATMLDSSSGELLDAAACFSYSSPDIYVSAESILISRQYSDSITLTEGDRTLPARTVMSEISVLSYTAQSMDIRGSFNVRGALKDQYSMDEYDGMLRVVTTVSTSRIYYDDYYFIGDEAVSDGDTPSYVTPSEIGTNASLYIFDLETLAPISSVECFAPWGEWVQSVRFDGSSAYVCTSYQLSDPVFFFDLSDPASPTYTDTGVIPGFSSSLINMGNGFLLGVGVGDSWSDVKIEVYAEGQGTVESVSEYVIPNASYSTNYKSYFIDREQGLFGICVVTYSVQEEFTYLLLSFDGYQLRLAASIEMQPHFDLPSVRAAMADGYLYVLADKLYVLKMN